ncbi:hypothetical protein N7495_003904 [Penicillium taxi]|uniref:uncharacterized protein n=1 Tax=Penicillium taxi TaxID=168475 RepID=UPI002544D394|nr:uncharacterized protein N7495_003904 [Penicillium taxi]KAJ5899160.1 hypothetical protein N7495_003904 [Penicillium taxi]
MISNHSRGVGTWNQSPRAPPSRYYAGKQNLRDSIDDPPSPLLSGGSSDTAYSDERSIYNAIRVTTSNEEPRSYGRARMQAVMEEGMAANMAMFVPEGSSDDWSPNQPPSRSPKIDRYKQILSDQIQQHQHRKTMSLDTTHKNGQTPHWLGNTIPAIITAQPPFPPPVRMPTPPGLPSFNTPEAMEYSAQFLASPSTVSPSQREFYNGQRTGSYSGTFRRLLGLSPSTGPEPSPLSVTGIGRAEDGTVVQGRFPYRQSGHGMNLAREIDDHPFHRNSLPAAQFDTEGMRGEVANAKDPQNSHQRRSTGFVFPSPDRPSFFSGQRAYTYKPRTRSQSRASSRALALLGISQRTTPRSASTAPLQSSVQAVGLTSYSQQQPAQAQDPDTNLREVNDTKPVHGFFKWLSHVLCCGSGVQDDNSADESTVVSPTSLEASECTSGSTWGTAREETHTWASTCSSLLQLLKSIWPSSANATCQTN